METSLKKLLISLTALFFILLLPGCDKDEVEPLPAKIGDTYQGGIVFYIDPTLKHGLIAAPADLGFSIEWWNGTFVTTGATSETNGATNTTIIIKAQGTSYPYAALKCRNYRGGNFSDWYLPSKNELDQLFQHKVNIGGFSNSIYWSSTEFDLGEVWVQDFETGQQHLDNSSDAANVAVRAIRAY
jgi:hypothetical protein